MPSRAARVARASALVAFAALGACGGATRGADDPTSPTFESRTTDDTRTTVTMTPPPSADIAPLGGSPEGGVRTGAKPDSPVDAAKEAAAPSARVETNRDTERSLCDALLERATVRVEDIASGVAISITPKSNEDRELTLAAARRVEESISAAGRPGQPAPATNDACSLFDLGRMGARAALSETPGAVRVLVTANDGATVKDLRRKARSFATAATAPAPTDAP